MHLLILVQLTELESISTSFLDVMQTIATDFQTKVQSQADKLENKAKETISEISKQAGKMSENFSSSLSEQKEAMNDIFLKHRIGTWMLTAVQILSLGAFILWVISQTS